MSRTRDQDPGEISVGSDHATIRRPHEQRLLVAMILHREDRADGQPGWIVLDRLVHRSGETTIGTWGVSGAVTTKLRR